MELLIFLLWVLFVFATPVAFAVSGYCAVVPGKHAFGIIGKGILAFLVHVVIAFVTMWPIFLMVYGGAHSDPVGEALNWSGRLIMSAIVIAFGICGWLLSSFVYGRLIGIPPRKRLV